jgi:hypothetical protein
MTPLEQLFRFEVEFHRQFRETTEQRANAAAAHASFALQNGYEALLRTAGRVTGGDVEAMKERLALAGDPRDVLAARDSLRQLLGISPLET